MKAMATDILHSDPHDHPSAVYHTANKYYCRPSQEVLAEAGPAQLRSGPEPTFFHPLLPSTSRTDSVTGTELRRVGEGTRAGHRGGENMVAPSGPLSGPPSTGSFPLLISNSTAFLNGRPQARRRGPSRQASRRNTPVAKVHLGSPVRDEFSIETPVKSPSSVSASNLVVSPMNASDVSAASQPGLDFPQSNRVSPPRSRGAQLVRDLLANGKVAKPLFNARSDGFPADSRLAVSEAEDQQLIQRGASKRRQSGSAPEAETLRGLASPPSKKLHSLENRGEDRGVHNVVADLRIQNHVLRERLAESTAAGGESRVLQARVRSLEEENDSLKSEVSRLRGASSAVPKALEEQLAGLREENAKLSAAAAASHQLENKLGFLQDENAALREDNAVLGALRRELDALRGSHATLAAERAAKSRLEEEIDCLSRENAAFRGSEVELGVLRRENAALRTQLSVAHNGAHAPDRQRFAFLDSDAAVANEHLAPATGAAREVELGVLRRENALRTQLSAAHDRQRISFRGSDAAVVNEHLAPATGAARGGGGAPLGRVARREAASLDEVEARFAAVLKENGSLRAEIDRFERALQSKATVVRGSSEDREAIRELRAANAELEETLSKRRKEQTALIVELDAVRKGITPPSSAEDHHVVAYSPGGTPRAQGPRDVQLIKVIQTENANLHAELANLRRENAELRPLEGIAHKLRQDADSFQDLHDLEVSEPQFNISVSDSGMQTSPAPYLDRLKAENARLKGVERQYRILKDEFDLTTAVDAEVRSLEYENSNLLQGEALERSKRDNATLTSEHEKLKRAYANSKREIDALTEENLSLRNMEPALHKAKTENQALKAQALLREPPTIGRTTLQRLRFDEGSDPDGHKAEVQELQTELLSTRRALRRRDDEATELAQKCKQLQAKILILEDRLDDAENGLNSSFKRAEEQAGRLRKAADDADVLSREKVLRADLGASNERLEDRLKLLQAELAESRNAAADAKRAARLNEADAELLRSKLSKAETALRDAELRLPSGQRTAPADAEDQLRQARRELLTYKTEAENLRSACRRLQSQLDHSAAPLSGNEPSESRLDQVMKAHAEELKRSDFIHARQVNDLVVGNGNLQRENDELKDLLDRLRSDYKEKTSVIDALREDNQELVERLRLFDEKELDHAFRDLRAAYDKQKAKCEQLRRQLRSAGGHGDLDEQRALETDLRAADARARNAIGHLEDAEQGLNVFRDKQARRQAKKSGSSTSKPTVSLKDSNLLVEDTLRSVCSALHSLGAIRAK
ncbi:hypothetical protein DIPPA_30898 [Diplonema papillatum]|nr:hypothetical protein DIPPA_30898 [Diplonema papillatum]